MNTSKYSKEEVKTKSVLGGEDIDLYKSYLQEINKELGQMDIYMQAVKTKCRNEAWTFFEQEKSQVARVVGRLQNMLNNSIAAIASDGVKNAENNLKSLREKINKNKTDIYEHWQSKEALFEEDKRKIDQYIENEMELLKNTEQTINFAKKSRT